MQPMKSMDVCEWCTVEVLQIFMRDMGLNQFRFSTWSMTSLSRWTGSNMDFNSPKCVWQYMKQRCNSIHLLPQFLQDGYFLASTWLDEPFRKSMSLVQPHNPKNDNLIANTSTTFHRDERLGNTYAMHGKCNYAIEMPEETSFLS